MPIAGTIVMIATGVGAVVGIMKSKAGASWGQPVAVVCACVTLVLAVIGVLPGENEAEAILATAQQYHHASGVTVGEHLAKHFNGSRALILAPPVNASETPDPIQASILEGLKQGMGEALELVEALALEAPENFLESTMGEETGAETRDELHEFMAHGVMNYEMWFDAAALGAVLDQHQDACDVVISTVGLPLDFPDSPIAQRTNLPDLVIFNAYGFGLKDLITEGTLDAVVLSKPEGWKASEEAPEDIAAAFDKRYLLVTPANVEDMAAAYPDLLGP